ncbi:DUF3316 domain-containing protein, partial [Vibrio sp. 1-Bac 57]
KTQDKSYQLGLNKLAKLYALSPAELSKVLNISWDADPKLTHINDGGYITVEKMKYLDGSIFYKSKLNFSYHVAEEDFDDYFSRD